jgi:polyhydroxyalkanoate synthase
VESEPGELNADFWEWAGGDGEIRVDGARVLDGLADVEVPALFIAGAADKLAPPSTVEHAFDAWGKDRPAVPKRYFVAGRDYGHAADYGHGDMAIGAHVGVELFEPIAKFLGPEAQPEDARAETGEEAASEVLGRRATP